MMNKNVLLGVTGGIAAYKCAELVRLFKKAGANVQVVMSASAKEFVTPLTLSTLSGNPVAGELFDMSRESRISHIALADTADVLVVAPATANFIAKIAHGLADDLLSTIFLATQAPVLLAPAMNVHMWEHPQTQENLAHLKEISRVTVVGPGSGDLACGYEGDGRMSEPAEILAAAAELLLKKKIFRVKKS